MNWTDRAVRGVLAGLVLAALAAPAWAGQDEVEITVLAIRATKDNSDISPELKQIAEQLKKQFKYTGYKVEKKISGKAAVEKAFSGQLVMGYSVKVMPVKLDEKRVELKVEVSQKVGEKVQPKLSSTVTIPRGRYQLFGGWRIADSDVLIVAVAGK